MEIIYIATSRLPSREANSIQVAKMCQSFSRLGNDVTLLAPNRVSGGRKEVYDRYGMEENIDIRYLPWKPLKGYQFAPRAALAAKRADPDIVYCRSIAGCYFSSLLGVPAVYESHSPADCSHPITDRMFSSLITENRLRKLVVISDSLRRYYEKEYGIGDRLLTAHNGAESIEGKAIPEIERKARLTAGYVGNLYKGKGISMVVRLAERMPSVSFHVVGGKKEDIRRWEGSAAENENLHLHGYVKHSEVPDYLASFDVLLAPYQNEVLGSGGSTDLSRWMSPLKLFEYMSAGKPIVCSDLKVLREVITDGETAVLCEPEDVDEWADSIRWLDRNPEKASEIARRARRLQRDKYTYDARAERILDSLS